MAEHEGRATRRLTEDADHHRLSGGHLWQDTYSGPEEHDCECYSD